MIVDIHVHSEHSPLDGISSVRELVERAKELGKPGLALTDHASTSGLYELQKQCNRVGIKPILGSEFYLSQEIGTGHLVLLAKSDVGLKNIFKLQEYSYKKSFNRRPLINMDILRQFSTDLVCTSACIANIIPKLILADRTKDAVDVALRFKSIFGDDFYLEMQSNSLQEQRKVNKALVDINKMLGIPLIITNDIHYTYKEDGYVHEVALAMQQNRKMNDPKRWKFDTNDFYMKSEDEMRKELDYIQKDILDSAISNTVEIMDKCNAEIKRGRYLPSFPLTNGKSENEYLRELTTKGYKEIYIDKGMHTKELADKVRNELDVIEETGYSGYFLIVQDYINHGRGTGIIIGDGRGSGAGSKVCYLTGITKVDPEKYDLLFERFLAPGRTPDIDVDFSDSDAIFSYLQSVYGDSNVARVGANSTITCKSGLIDVFRIHDYPDSLIAKIKGLLPNRLKFTLKEALEESAELREYTKKYEKEFKVVERLEGTIKNPSTHAGGVVIYQGLNELAPIRTTADDRNKSIIGYDKDTLEEIGFYKFDLLWLKTLKIVETTLRAIEKHEGITIDMHDIDYEDKEVYDMLCRGNVLEVFQLADQRDKVVEQQPRNFKDLIAINALIRPGVGDWNEYIARRKGKEYSIHQDRESYMRETEGVMTYQEQFMLDCKTYAGWDLAFADSHVRKNKDIRNDEKLRNKFYNDVQSRGYNLELAKEIWEEICKAVEGGYSFNKSHSTSYAVLSYGTAWLKCKYPKYFYSSAMTYANTQSTELAQRDISEILVEVKKNDIKILPPDINESDNEFKATKEGIRYCITSIRNVGESAIEAIKTLRPIKSLDDMLKRGQKRHLKKNVVSMLIKAGCFDFENTNREEMLQNYYASRKEEYEAQEWNDKLKLEYEKETLGTYLTKHPMDKYAFKELSEYKDGDYAVIAGEVIEVVERYDRNGAKMAFVVINTSKGNTRCLIFASAWNNRKSTIQDDVQVGKLTLFRGRKDKTNILVDSTEVLG